MYNTYIKQRIMETTMGTVLLFLLFVGCEEKSEKNGENENLVFSTRLINQDDTLWKLSDDAPLATHTHFEVGIDGWVLNRQEFESPQQKATAYTTFTEKYNETSIDVVKTLMSKEEFEFTSDLTILGSTSNQSSTKHMGSAKFTTSQEGHYTITATGIQSDFITVEVVDPVSWKISQYRDEIATALIDKGPHFAPLGNFCLVSGSSMQFNPVLLDKQGRRLSGTIPKINISTDNENIRIGELEDTFELEVEEFNTPTKLNLDIQNVFGESLFSPKDIDICVAKESDIKGMNITVLNDEVNDQKESDIALLNKATRKYARRLKWSQTERILLLAPLVESDKSIPNLPIEVSVKDGLIVEFNSLYNIEDDIEVLTQIGSTITTRPNTILMVFFHKNRDEVFTIKSGNALYEQVVPKFVPKDEEME